MTEQKAATTSGSNCVPGAAREFGERFEGGSSFPIRAIAGEGVI